MPKQAQTPDGRVYEFPDEATKDQILDFLNRKAGGFASPKGTLKADTEKKSTDNRIVSPRFPRGISVGEQFTQKEMTSALPIAGAAVGSMVGPEGTFLGAAGGKGLQIGIDSLFDPKVASEHAGAKGLDKTARGIGLEGTKQMAMDLGLGLLAKGGSLIGSKYLARYARLGQVEARAAAAATGHELTGLEKVGPPVTRTEFATQKASDALEASFSQLGPKKDIQAAGQKVMDVIETSEKNFHDAFSKEYVELDEIAKTSSQKTGIKQEVVRKAFGDATKEVEKRARVAAPETMAPAQFVKAMEEDINGLPNLDFSTAHHLRSEWLRKARETGLPSVVEAANKGAMALDKGMEEYAGRVGPKFLRQWRELDAGYKTGKELFNSTFMEGAMRRNPEALLNAVGNNQPTKAMAIRDGLLSHGGKEGREAWGTFQRSFAERLAAKPENLQKALSDKGDETLSAVFGNTPAGQQILRGMRDQAKAIEAIKAVDKSGDTGTALKYGIGRLLKIPVDKADQGAAWLFVKAAENPKANALLIDGLTKAPMDFGRAMANIERAVALSVKGGRVASPNSFTTLDKIFSLGNAASAKKTQSDLPSR